MLVAASAAIWYAVDRYRSDDKGADGWDHYGPYQDEHGDHTPRAVTDPMVAHVRGCISRDGKPVASQILQVTVYPTGMSWTVDTGSSGPDGC